VKRILLRALWPPAASWDLPKRRHRQVIDLGAEQHDGARVTPAHDPNKALTGLCCVVTSLMISAGSVWLWHRDSGSWKAEKVIEVPAEPADPDQLRPIF